MDVIINALIFLETTSFFLYLKFQTSLQLLRIASGQKLVVVIFKFIIRL